MSPTLGALDPASVTVAIWGIFLAVVQILGIGSAVHALMQVRTAQGTIAWCIALATFPLLSLPFYWIFGRNKFYGYIETLRAAVSQNKDLADDVAKAMQPHHGVFRKEDHPCEYALDILTWRRFTSGNRVDLLIDGEATFKAIFEAIEEAQEYILIQFFIVKEDEIGMEFKRRLVAKAREGVAIYFLFDEIGTHRLSKEYIADLRSAGVEIYGFGTGRIPASRFQLNFRNHRKIVLTDGRFAFVGGHNVGDEYLGRDAKFGRWRDTHVRVEGPAVISVQTTFLEDWFWATRTLPDLTWTPRRCGSHDLKVLPLETGPVDRIEAATLMFHHLIGSARTRLWIASPYFVPDEGIANALQLAALRGVDVRIMLPDKPDHHLVYLASFSFLEAMDAAGVKIYRYQDGFLHQKVVLVDQELAIVGTTNLDNRSMRLNFEVNVAVSDAGFAKRVESMLEEDFRNCRLTDAGELTARSLPFRLAVRFARLLSPIL